MRNCGLRVAVLGLLGVIVGCGGPRVDPQLAVEPRLEATIESLGDELLRVRLQLDSLTLSSDYLRVELGRLQLELQRLKEIDLRLKPARPGRPPTR